MDRKIIRDYVKKIHLISQSLDEMMELNDRKYNIASYLREKDKLKELLKEYHALSEYIKEYSGWTGLL